MIPLHAFERRRQRLAPPRVFWRRFGIFAGIASFAMLVWVGIGTVLFHAEIERGNWYDAFRYAALIASGMGPAPDLRVSTDLGKVLESLYALFCGFVLLAAAGVAASPIVHRVFHHFHVDDTGD